MYRDECGVEYDTTCHQELSHTFTIKGYEPQKMKRDLKETLVPVTQGKVVVTSNNVFIHDVVTQVVTQCPDLFVTRCPVYRCTVCPAPCVSQSLTSSAAPCSAPSPRWPVSPWSPRTAGKSLWR